MAVARVDLEDRTVMTSVDMPPKSIFGGIQRGGAAITGLGFALLLASFVGIGRDEPGLFMLLSIGLIIVGGVTFFLSRIILEHPGIKNNHIFLKSVSSRGWHAWFLGVIFTGFYVVLYWFPAVLENWIRLTNPISLGLSGRPSDQWFLYGLFYTIAVMVMGVRMVVKYRHNRYEILRTASVVFFQLGFAFLIPNFLKALNQPEFYFTYFWPLKYNYLFPSDINWLMAQPGGLGGFMVFWGGVMTFIATPILTYFFGKRWYCSWVCGCGGLAETLGDPWRHLSNKSLRAWRIERWLIHSVLLFICVTTLLLWTNTLNGGAVLGGLATGLAKIYGFAIGAIFSGIIGVGFYPILGSRVWCRFGCPMAAILGIIQRYFSRFRITTNGNQCISCGNCSVYCEMGIDVRWYAQRQQNIVRASCVGCGICSAVCPRGVLRLENGPVENRY